MLLLGACSSLENAGYTEGSFSGQVCGQPVNLSYKSGKEFGGITGGCSIGPDGTHEAHFEVSGVAAFAGQQIAAGVAQGVTDGIKQAAGPILAAAKAAGGVP